MPMASLLLLLLVLLIIPLSFLLVLRLLVRPRAINIPIRGRHVFISGGSSGIGLSLAHQAASAGASRVTILARSVAKLEDARNSIRRATGADISAFSADVRDFDAVKKAVDAAGPVDVLICNHGVFAAQDFETQDLEVAKFMVDVNLMGTLNLIKAALPTMRRSRPQRGPGSIAIMSSQAGQVGLHGFAAYSASKFGLRGLGEALQQELIEYGIHVSLIFPPDTETPGLVEEKKRRPEVTSILVGYSSAMQADDVARKTLNGIKSGTFTIPCNLDGLMLAIATAGLSPQRSFLIAFVEVILAGLMRLVGLCYLWTWYNLIERWHAKQEQSQLK